MAGFGSFFSEISGETAATRASRKHSGIHRGNGTAKQSGISVTPLWPLLTELIDFNRLRLQEEIQLTVCATNPRTAKRRVFTNQDVSIDALLASACLPHLFPAVEGPPESNGHRGGAAKNGAPSSILGRCTE